MDRIKRYERRFTLIELLTVVALISMLMAIGVPAFARMIRGSKVDESARNIKLALEQAQMRAAAERRYVAVIFPNGIVDDSLVPYRMGGFRTAYVRNETSGTYSFIRWVDGSEWSNAPDGAALVKVATSSSGVTPVNGYVTGCSLSAGALEGANAFAIVSGIVDERGQNLTISGRCAIVFNPYGGIDGGAKLYLLVSEALIEGLTVTYPTRSQSVSDSTANYRVLKVNNLTGRVEFE